MLHRYRTMIGVAQGVVAQRKGYWRSAVPRSALWGTANSGPSVRPHDAATPSHGWRAVLPHTRHSSVR